MDKFHILILKISRNNNNDYNVFIIVHAVPQSYVKRSEDRESDLVKVLHYHRPYPREYALSTQVSDAIASLPDLNLVDLRKNIITAQTRQSIAPWCYVSALACLLLGLILRRV
ncbi:MAG: hypothetical protein ACI8T1_001948 [Verrucomicrobiales bacterium]|jgi:hypothetical protein